MNRKRMSALLCEQYNDIICLLRVMGVAEDDVEDLAADSLLEGLKHIGDLRDETKLDKWVKTIAANKARKYFGSRSRRSEISNMVAAETGEMDVYDSTADDATVEKILQDAEEAMLVGQLIDSLPEISRRIIRLRFWGDYKFNEIAEILNMNTNSTKTIYRRSLLRLKRNYTDIFGKEDVRGQSQK